MIKLNCKPWLDASSMDAVRCPATLIFSKLACAAVLAGALLLTGGSAQAANVLINPGAETGTTAGWTMDPDGSIA